MGACVSSHNKDPESDMKFQMSNYKTDNFVFSPVKEKALVNGDRPIAELGLKSQPDPLPNFPDLGSKEETFFDSQAWLDSDCDDEFMSVNGEFTPSRGNTPLHYTFTNGAPRINKSILDDPAPGAIPQPSPRVRLSDLFKLSFRAKEDADDEQNTSGNLSDTNYASSLQSRETPNRNVKGNWVKPMRSLQCCLPNMLVSRTFNERKMTSPVHSVG